MINTPIISTQITQMPAATRIFTDFFTQNSTRMISTRMTQMLRSTDFHRFLFTVKFEIH